MKLLTPTPSKRLNEVTGFLFLAAGLLLLLSFASFQPADPSWDTVSGRIETRNLIGPVGAHIADLFLQAFGLASFLFPLLAFSLGWKWIRSEAIDAPLVRFLGSGILLASLCGAAALLPDWRLFDHAILPGGVAGYLVADSLRGALNFAGSAVVLATAIVISTYLVSSFTLEKLQGWLAPVIAFFIGIRNHFRRSMERRREEAIERRERKRAEREAEELRRAGESASAAELQNEPNSDPAATRRTRAAQPVSETLPWGDPDERGPDVSGPEAQPVPNEPGDETSSEIPICILEEPDAREENVLEFPFNGAIKRRPEHRLPTLFRLPSTELLNEIPIRSAYDEQELKSTAAAIKAKFEEFNVFGSVTQINPGPVVTTFEFKPEAGIKYSRITTLTEDLCLGLQAESILIERIPGKPTVGIEVPNTRREVISLRAILESEEFETSQSHLTISMGKDINGRIKVAALDAMPHALIAGSTGSGKSVMINSLIMSILYKSTPDEVRMIMVDPKRVELGIYEGIPHLLTPVITDPRKATNALKNAVLEMERRLRLLAEQGVRNIDQYNKKIRKLQEEPRSLFAEEATQDEPKPLP
ncbi:MAG TPA: DNA translocase FtsK 4TM domain-containing protein, partial [Candidatus Dormibacteraeota bacterium]|nr:DNA translocase FtsK 4TM domain-containing protein [Candidatus Dormibacteraeota bacterium]